MELDELKLTEAGENVTTFLGLDEEERERLDYPRWAAAISRNNL
jgi:hypothetical protein